MGGWTSAASRPAMIENLGEMLVEKPGKFQERAAAERVPDICKGCGWEYRERLVGSHDDCVMAMAIARAVRRRRGAGWKGQR